MLDASGSMAAAFRGKAKITVAKEVLSETLKTFRQESASVWWYGHREKKDYRDVEELAPRDCPTRKP
jgi:hypothetical protein